MFVKQIDLKTALELAARGREVMMLTPTTTEPKKWTDYEPDTLRHMLDGCLFFRKEPALEKKLLVPPPPTGKNDTERTRSGKKKQIDTGKLLALHKAGWSNVKIADELGISDMTVGRYLKLMESEEKGLK